MNTPIKLPPTTKIAKELETYGTFFPRVTDVLFNVSKDECGRIVLNTVVHFIDGTKITATNSGKSIYLDSNGSLSIESKRVGFLLAIAKRLCGIPTMTEDGKVVVKTDGFIDKLGSICSSAKVQMNIPKAENVEKRKPYSLADELGKYMGCGCKSNPPSSSFVAEGVESSLDSIIKSLTDIISRSK